MKTAALKWGDGLRLTMPKGPDDQKRRADDIGRAINIGGWSK